MFRTILSELYWIAFSNGAKQINKSLVCSQYTVAGGRNKMGFNGLTEKNQGDGKM